MNEELKNIDENGSLLLWKMQNFSNLLLLFERNEVASRTHCLYKTYVKNPP